MQRRVQQGLIPCYPILNGRLGDALAGRLLTHVDSSMPDVGDQDAIYRAGFSAGAQWAREMATGENLGQLEAATCEESFAARSWLRGFVDGALTTWCETPCADPS